MVRLCPYLGDDSHAVPARQHANCLQPDVDLNSRSGTCHSYRLEGQPVKEEEERDTEEKAGAGTTSLVEDAPCIKSRPAPCDVLHAHTHTSEAARMQCSLDVNSGTPGTTEPEECGAVWDLPLSRSRPCP